MQMHVLYVNSVAAPEMCGRGRVRKLFERPRTDADATLHSVADTPHWICKLHVRDECQ